MQHKSRIGIPSLCPLMLFDDLRVVQGGNARLAGENIWLNPLGQKQTEVSSRPDHRLFGTKRCTKTNSDKHYKLRKSTSRGSVKKISRGRKNTTRKLS